MSLSLAAMEGWLPAASFSIGPPASQRKDKATFQDPPKPAAISSLAMSRSGQFVASSTDLGVVSLFDSHSGTHRTTVRADEVGASCTTFTHHETTVLHAATNPSKAGLISMHELDSNTVVRFFRGHQAKVTSIAVNPGGTFASADADGHLFCWDLRSPNPAFHMQLRSGGCVGFDAAGKVLAYAATDCGVMLFDSAKVQGGEFLQNADVLSRMPELPPGPLRASARFSSMQFSRDNRWLLLGMPKGQAMLLHSYSLEPFMLLGGHKCAEHGTTACFSAGEEFALVGGGDGVAHAYDIRTTADLPEAEAGEEARAAPPKGVSRRLARWDGRAAAPVEPLRPRHAPLGGTFKDAAGAFAHQHETEVRGVVAHRTLGLVASAGNRDVCFWMPPVAGAKPVAREPVEVWDRPAAAAAGGGAEA